MFSHSSDKYSLEFFFLFQWLYLRWYAIIIISVENDNITVWQAYAWCSLSVF